MHSSTRRVVAAVAALATAATVSACRGSSASEHAGQTSSSTAQDEEIAKHNADDVVFLQNMIPHHQQAVDMAAMVPIHTTNVDVITLANHISQDELPEIQAFSAMLLQWDQPVNPDRSGHGGMGMAGMVDQTTLNELDSLHGADFDRLWTQSMIWHHQGAITMAQQEIAHGQNQDAISLANLIVTAQRREIDYMNHLLEKATQ